MTGAAGERPATVVLGLDVGTTAAKAVAFGVGSCWRRTALREYPLLEPHPGWQVQDPEAILAAAGAALQDAVTAADGAEVIGVAVSSAMHGLMGLDPAGRPLTPLLTWADGRSREQARELRRSGQAAELHRVTGVPVHPMTPLTKLLWFREHDPSTWVRARWWVGLKDYLLHWLTGTLITELSSASGTGLLDMSTRAWSPLALQLTGLSETKLPQIRPTTATLGMSATTAVQVGLRVGTPVVLGAADGPLGNLGTGATSPGVAGLSLGTSGAVRMLVSQPQVDPDGALFCYALTDDAWVLGGAISTGGGVVRWARSSLAPDLPEGASADDAILELAAAVSPGSDGLIMLPHLLPERSPLWDPDLPGAYLGLRRRHTRAHLIRAAVEGVAAQLGLIVDQLNRIEPVTSLRLTGGSFRSPLWAQIIAATVNRPLYVTGDADGTALGAAALGLFALGHVTDLTHAADALAHPRPGEEVRIDPNPELVAVYRQQRDAVLRLIDALSPVRDLYAQRR